jgi:aspartate/methionine/tyrosine aminotransferase
MSFAIPLSERAKALLEHPRETSAIAATEVAPAHIRLAVEAALDRGETHYTERPGILLLREKIVALLRDRFGIEMSAKNDIIVTCGVTEARFLAVERLLQAGDTLAAPGSSELLFGVALLRSAQLVDSIPANAHMVYLRSSIGEGLLRSHLALVPASALILFEVDRGENGFHPGQLEGLQNRTITIGGLGEESWRIGYLASPGGPSGLLQDFKQALTICSTNLSQWALLAALEAL